MRRLNLIKTILFIVGSVFLFSSCASLEQARVLFSQGQDDAALKMAAPYLEDDDPRIRLQAVNLIGDIGGDKAGSLLLPVLDDEDEEVKIAAVKAIGNIKYEKASKKLVEMSISTNDEVFEEVAVAIRKIGTPAIDLLVKRYNRSNDSREKKAYKRAMFEIGPSVAASIAKSMKGKSYFENRDNFELLIEFKDPQVAAWMLDEIENESVADMVVEGLVKLGNQAIRPVINKLRSVASQSGYTDLKERLIKTLGDLKAKPAVSLLEELSKSDDERVSNAAEFSLRKIRGF